MTINFSVRGERNPSRVYLRFSDGRKFDCFLKLPIMIDPEVWDAKRQEVRSKFMSPSLRSLNGKLTDFRHSVYEIYGQRLLSGDCISREWLLGYINSYFICKVDKKESAVVKGVDGQLTLRSFIGNWMDTKIDLWETPDGQPLKDRVKQQYAAFYSSSKDFEGYDLPIESFGNKEVKDFVKFLREDKKYAYETIKRKVTRLKFFLNRAEEDGIRVDATYKRGVTSGSKSNIIAPYINEEQISKIAGLDLGNQPDLDSDRDFFIIGLWTGLRVHDFYNRLETSHFVDNYKFIEITSSKTNTFVSIPVHSMVKAVLDKRNGALPPRTKYSNFNSNIKEICKIAGLDENVNGRLFNIKTQRKEDGVYPFYKLVSSHICRRSFATNLFGKVPNSLLMEVGGWASERQMLEYIKKAKREYAIEFANLGGFNN